MHQFIVDSVSDVGVKYKNSLTALSAASSSYPQLCCMFVGERLIQFASESLVTEVLIQPQLNTLIQCIRNLLSSFTKHRHIIHAGYTFTGNGSWILQVPNSSYYFKYQLKLSHHGTFKLASSIIHNYLWRILQ